MTQETTTPATRGVASPYADDPRRYAWDWCQDGYFYADGEQEEVENRETSDSDEVRRIIQENGLTAGDNDLSKDFEKNGLGAEGWANIYTDQKGRVISVVVNSEAGGFNYDPPAWADVDWEDEANVHDGHRH